MRIKKGDTVMVMAGKNRGKTGKVLAVLPNHGTITIEGLNLYKKHRRATREGEKGETVTVARPIREANVMPHCSTCGRGVRVGFREDGGKKIRFCRRCKTTL